MNKILSIIVPSYNMERYLGQCLSSLLFCHDDNGCEVELQKALEVLVVNDGSKDRTSEIAHRYATQHPDVFRVIDKENGNYGSCINAALPLALGEFVKILDADDSFDTSCLPKYLDFLRHCQDVDVVYSNFDFVDEDGRVTRRVKYNLPRQRADLAELSEDCCKTLEMQSVAYRTRLVQELQYSQSTGISYTDQEWMFGPMVAMKTFSFCDCSLYKYLVGREGQTIGVSTLIKNRWMIVQIATKLVNLFSTLPEGVSVGARQYLHHRMIQRLEVVYSMCLLDPRRYERLSDLVELDRVLKTSCCQMFDISDSFLGKWPLRIKYVNTWRVCQTDRTLLLILYRFICRCKRCFCRKRR